MAEPGAHTWRRTGETAGAFKGGTSLALLACINRYFTRSNTRVTKATLTLCVAAAVSLAGACGGGSGSAAATDGGPAQNADRKPTRSACEGELVFPPRKLGITGGVISMMAADETNLYFAAQNEEGIFRVPVGGGEPVRLTIEGEEKSVALFWRYEGKPPPPLRCQKRQTSKARDHAALGWSGHALHGTHRLRRSVDPEPRVRSRDCDVDSEKLVSLLH